MWERASGVYLLDQLNADLHAGHNVRGTVFIQCGYSYRTDGPEELRPVGETERVVAIARDAAPGVCAGIVGYCDFRQIDRVDAVLEAHIAAGAGRFRGIRQSAGWDAAVVNTTTAVAPRYILADPTFRAGLARLGNHGLSYECSLYYPQLAELADVARAFPDLSILANHCAGPIMIGPYAEMRQETFVAWAAAVRDLASCPNVVVKLGGQAMPIRGFYLARGRAAAVVRAVGGGVAADHGNVDRSVRRGSLHVREQLPGGQGHVLLPGDLECLQAAGGGVLGGGKGGAVP